MSHYGPPAGTGPYDYRLAPTPMDYAEKLVTWFNYRSSSNALPIGRRVHEELGSMDSLATKLQQDVNTTTRRLDAVREALVIAVDMEATALPPHLTPELHDIIYQTGAHEDDLSRQLSVNRVLVASLQEYMGEHRMGLGTDLVQHIRDEIKRASAMLDNIERNIKDLQEELDSTIEARKYFD